MIKVTNTVSYEIRDDKGSHPVFITINAKGHSCHFAGSGDYGDYSHYWGSMGSEFREFLTKLDYGDFFTKVSGYQKMNGLIKDVEKSKESIKKDILFKYRELLIDHDLWDKESRKNNSTYKKLRDEAKSLIEAIDDMDHCMSDEFDRAIYDATESKLDMFWNYYDEGFSYEYQKDAQCEGFWRQFKKLCEYWKEELSNETNL